MESKMKESSILIEGRCRENLGEDGREIQTGGDSKRCI